MVFIFYHIDLIKDLHCPTTNIINGLNDVSFDVKTSSLMRENRERGRTGLFLEGNCVFLSSFLDFLVGKKSWFKGQGGKYKYQNLKVKNNNTLYLKVVKYKELIF